MATLVVSRQISLASTSPLEFAERTAHLASTRRIRRGLGQSSALVFLEPRTVQTRASASDMTRMRIHLLGQPGELDRRVRPTELVHRYSRARRPLSPA